MLPDTEIKAHSNIRQMSVHNAEREELQEKLLIKPKNFQLLEIFTKPWYSAISTDSSRKHRLGVFHRGTLNKQKILCRVIAFDRLTSYILEDYFSEISRLKKIKMKSFLVLPKGYALKDTTMTIFHEEYISLYELLHSLEESRRVVLD